MDTISTLDQATLEELETELWRRETRFDKRRMDEIMSSDFFEIGRSGRYWTREEIISGEEWEIRATIPLPKFQARLLSQDIAQTTYISEVMAGEKLMRSWRSSIWSKIDDRWCVRYHQGTPYADDA